MNKLLATLIAGNIRRRFDRGYCAGRRDRARRRRHGKGRKEESEGFGRGIRQPRCRTDSGRKIRGCSAAEATKSKAQPKTKTKFDEKAAQDASRESTNPADAKAAVAASRRRARRASDARTSRT